MTALTIQLPSSPPPIKFLLYAALGTEKHQHAPLKGDPEWHELRQWQLLREWHERHTKLELRQHLASLELPDQLQLNRNEYRCLAATYVHCGHTCFKSDQFEQAEILYASAFAILESLLGPDHEELINVLHYLGLSCRIQEKHRDAEEYYNRAFVLALSHYGDKDTRVATRLNFLAGLYNSQNRYSLAQKLVERSLMIYQADALANEDNIRLSLLTLALLCRKRGKDCLAAGYYQRYVFLKTQQYCADNLQSALVSLAELFYLQDRLEEADTLLRHSFLAGDDHIWPSDPFVAESLTALASWYVTQSRFREAEPMFKRAVAISEKTMASDHPQLKDRLSRYAKLLRTMCRHHEAESIELRLAQASA